MNNWIERKIYKNSPEYKDYLSQRFGGSRLDISFEYDGHRWCYKYTSFDDSGDYDVIARPSGGSSTWENLVSCCTRCNTKKGNRTPEEDGPEVDDILQLAAIIREVDGNHTLGAAALAEAILSHPNSSWKPLN